MKIEIINLKERRRDICQDLKGGKRWGKEVIMQLCNNFRK